MLGFRDFYQLIIQGRGGSTQANYAVFRTKQNEISEVFNVGRTLDIVVEDGGPHKVRETVCVCDSELIPNSMIYPI